MTDRYAIKLNLTMNNYIIVVDDEAISLTSVRTLLAAEDLKVVCLPSGKALLKYMGNHDADLILLDIMMPEMDGFETFAALRKLEEEQKKPEVPVIFLTGESDEKTERYGLKLGAADYIHKPFDRDILISRIRKTIGNSKKIQSLTEGATKDKLTGFLNKAEGVSRVTEIMAGTSGAFMMLDLDSFKLVNDLFGHDKGDEILRAFADVGRKNTRENDILCRIGGDEFLFFCCGLHGENALCALTSRLNEQFEDRAKQVLGADHGIPLGISVGAVMVPEYGTEYESLFKMADEAMYRTKHNGKHGCTLYENSQIINGQIQNPENELERITKIMAERNQGSEPLILGTEATTAIFQFMDRFNNRYGGKTLLLLFILTAKDITDENKFNDAMTSFEDLLKRLLGKSDIIMRNKNNEFFVLVPMLRQPDAESMINRIISAWSEKRMAADFEIRTASQIR